MVDHEDFLKPCKSCPRPTRFLALSRFSCMVVGGTFDVFHYGHASLLSTAFDAAREVHICVMSDEGVARLCEKNRRVRPFAERLNRVRRFAEPVAADTGAHWGVHKIDDPFTFALKSNVAERLDSIIVGEEERPLSRARMLNEMRAERGLTRLSLLVMPLIVDVCGQRLSATAVRTGECFLEVEAPLLKPTRELRRELKRPQGRLVKSVRELPEAKYVVAVGDAVTESLVSAGIPISVAVVDRRIARRKVEWCLYVIEKHDGEYLVVPHLPLFNEAGAISPAAWYVFRLAFAQRQPVVIRVYGEEDLLGFPAVILAPPDTLVVYGQPFDSGLVYAFADEARDRALELLGKMEVCERRKVSCTEFM